MHLPFETFQAVVASTPLVSIDLVVENSHGEILLGLRNNRPAQGSWFVPGGRVLKNESLDAAFMRLAHNELGREVERSSARSLGVYEHFYEDSFFGNAPDTHYVVLAYYLYLDIKVSQLPGDQHCDYHWWDKDEARQSQKVHENSRAYL